MAQVGNHRSFPEEGLAANLIMFSDGAEISGNTSSPATPTSVEVAPAELSFLEKARNLGTNAIKAVLATPLGEYARRMPF